MAGVNGIKIKVGQVWRTRGGALATVVSFDDDPDYPWRTTTGDRGEIWVTNSGREYLSRESNNDLIELVKDENGFTIWHGGEQPVETIGKTVEYRYECEPGCDGPADHLRWTHTGLTGDIHAYKVVEEAAQADSATLVEETLIALGWTFDGQAWVEPPKIDMVPNALDVQVGGTHYKDMTIQPWAAFDSWLSTEQHVGYLLGTAIAYLARFNSKGVGKGGLVDVEKATHTLQRLVEVAKKGSANED